MEEEEEDKRKTIGSSVCSLVCCCLPWVITGLVIASVHKDKSELYCGDDLPLYKWVTIYCAFYLGVTVSQFSCIVFKNKVTRIIDIICLFCVLGVQLGLLIWGATFFWGDSMTDKHGVPPLYKMMYALLVMGFIGMGVLVYFIIFSIIALMVLLKS